MRDSFAFLCVISTLFLIFFSCFSDQESTSLSSLNSAGEVCESQKVCDELHDPVSCDFNGKHFLGINECIALRKIETYACKKGISYEDNKVECEEISEIPNSTMTETDTNTAETPIDCGNIRICNKIYAPTLCNYEGKTYEGGNECEAKNKIELAACNARKPLNEENIDCVVKPIDESISSGN